MDAVVLSARARLKNKAVIYFLSFCIFWSSPSVCVCLPAPVLPCSSPAVSLSWLRCFSWWRWCRKLPSLLAPSFIPIPLFLFSSPMSGPRSCCMRPWPHGWRWFYVNIGSINCNQHIGNDVRGLTCYVKNTLNTLFSHMLAFSFRSNQSQLVFT